MTLEIQQQLQQLSPPQGAMSSLEALIQAAQYLEDSESELAYTDSAQGIEITT